MRSIVLAVGLLLSASVIQASDQAYLVKELNTSLAPYGSNPVHLQHVGNLVYFMTQSTNELWRTDGTEAGTFFLSKGARGRVAFGGKLWFTKADGDTQLWSTDGTVAGTQAIAMPADVTVRSLMAGPTHLYFLHGRKLWRTNGTAATTAQVSNTDLTPFSEDALGAPGWAAMGQSLYFLATTNAEVAPLALWSVNDNGLTLVRDLVTASFTRPRTTGSTLFLQRTDPNWAPSQYWKSDGTAAGTTALRSSQPITNGYIGPNGMLTSGTHVYFVGRDTIDGPQRLWRSDGTDAGTVVIADSLPGASTTFSAWCLSRLANGKMLFAGTPLGADANQFAGLWVVDGTTTSFLTNIPRPSGYLLEIPEAAGFALFDAQGLWRSDGTVAGTFPMSSDFTSLGDSVLLNGSMLFVATHPQYGREIFKTDGSLANTVLVKDVVAQSYGSWPAKLRAFKRGALLVAQQGKTDWPSSSNVARGDLWFSDGTGAGTQKLLANVTIEDLVPCGDRAFFRHTTPETGDELWATDGTPAGTAIVKDLQPGPEASWPGQMTCSDGRLFFLASPLTLWRSDGTAAGTLRIASVPPNTRLRRSHRHALYFENDYDLWRSDGTPGGTSLFKHLPGFPGAFVSSGGSLYFNSSDSDSLSSLWRTDGTAAGTSVLLRDQNLFPLGDFYGRLAFQESASQRLDGICLLNESGSGKTCVDPTWTTAIRTMNGRMFYASGTTLRVSDGITSAQALSGPGSYAMFLPAGGRMFLDYEYSEGTFLESDGTPAGTRAIFNGKAFEAVTSGGRVFIASDELYAYDLGVAAVSFAPRSIDTAGGQTITISGRGFVAPAAVKVGLSAATVTNATATSITFVAPPQEPGTYPIDLSLGDGRRMDLDESLTYTCAAPAAAIAPLSGSVLASTPVALQGSGGARCAWFPSTGLDDATSCTPTATVTESTTYTLMVFNASGCPSTNNASVRIYVRPPTPTGLQATAAETRRIVLTWNASAGAAQYEITRLSSQGPQVVTTTTTPSYSDTTVEPNNAYVYRVRALGPDAASPAATDVATTFAFSDDPVAIAQPLIRAAHMTELRTAVAALRSAASLPPVTFSDALTPGATLIRSAHMTELRSALAGAYAALGLGGPAFTNAVAIGNVVRGLDVQELRNALR